MANRDIPPLQYARVYQLITDFPHLEFEINGAISSPQEVHFHLSNSRGLRGTILYAMLCYAMLLSYSVNLMLLSVNAYSVNAITVSVLFTWRELYFKKYSLCISVSYCALHLISYHTILFQTAALSILLHGEYM